MVCWDGLSLKCTLSLFGCTLNFMLSVSVAQARQNFAYVLDESSRQPVVIERRGKSEAVIVDATEFERMREALEELDDIAAFDAAMAEEGENLPWEQAKADLGW